MSKKSKETASEFNNRMVSLHPGVFRADKTVLFCLLCNIQVNAKQVSTIAQHLETTKHKKSVERKMKCGSSSNQTLLTTLQTAVDESRNTNDFTVDLARCFLKANIPLHKISHPSMKESLEKHTKYVAPSESVLRQKCLPTLYDECVQIMKERAADNFIWVSLDECTDCEQRFVANFVFGVLGVEKECNKSYLFASKVLTKTNSTTTAKFFDKNFVFSL